MEHVKLKPASDTSAFFQAIAGFAVAALVMLGVGAKLAYNLIPAGNRNRYAEVFVYGCAAAGAIHACAYLIKGGL